METLQKSSLQSYAPEGRVLSEDAVCPWRIPAARFDCLTCCYTLLHNMQSNNAVMRYSAL